MLGKQLSHATWWLIVAGALLVQVTRLTNAISLTGASPEPTPLGPVYALKLAMGYVGFAVPTPGARTAVGVRFHERHGMAAGTALAVEGLVGLAQFCLLAILLIGLLTFTSASLELDLGAAIPDKLTLLLVVVLAAVVAAGITLAPGGKWRRVITAGFAGWPPKHYMQHAACIPRDGWGCCSEAISHPNCYLPFRCS